jgi:hypothetical protein
MDEIVKRHSVLLRKGCDMPAHFDLAQQPCADNWMLLEENGAPVLSGGLELLSPDAGYGRHFRVILWKVIVEDHVQQRPVNPHTAVILYKA